MKCLKTVSCFNLILHEAPAYGKSLRSGSLLARHSIKMKRRHR
nr:MAG TPA: hypothetical protein [Bacteriophage sp.]